MTHAERGDLRVTEQVLSLRVRGCLGGTQQRGACDGCVRWYQIRAISNCYPISLVPAAALCRLPPQKHFQQVLLFEPSNDYALTPDVNEQHVLRAAWTGRQPAVDIYGSAVCGEHCRCR